MSIDLFINFDNIFIIIPSFINLSLTLFLSSLRYIVIKASSFYSVYIAYF